MRAFINPDFSSNPEGPYLKNKKSWPILHNLFNYGQFSIKLHIVGLDASFKLD